MINEKYKWPISIISIILSFIFMISLIRFNTNAKNQSTNDKKLETVLDKESVMDVNINISDENWNWLIENAQQEEYRNADITINGETFYNVGIRPKGNSTLTTVANDDTTDRFSFKVKFDEYVSGQTYHGMKSIVLNNIIQDLTYMKEYISYDLCDFLGIATPEMQYSNIKINDKDWGLYLAIEVIDERYLENNFGTTEGNLYKPETMAMGGGNRGPRGNGGPGGNPPEDFDRAAPEDMNNGDVNKEDNTDQPQIDEDNPEQQGENLMSPGGNGGPGPGGIGGPNSGRSMGGADFKYIDDNISSYSTVRDSAVFKRTTDKDFKKVINMIKNLNDGTNLEEVLDVEEVLKYFAMNTYLANFDSYSGAMYHNYYLYEKDGKCQILPWDFNLSFGGFSQGRPGGHKDNNNTSGENNIINFPIDKVVTGDLEDAPLIGKLLEVDEYKELYHSYLEQIAEDYFNNGYFENLVNKLDNLINEYVKNDATAFYGYDKYLNSIPNLLLWGEDRTKSVIAQLIGEQPTTEYGDIKSDVDMDALTEMGHGGGPKGKGGRPENEDQDMSKDEGKQNNNKEAVNSQKPESDNKNLEEDAPSNSDDSEWQDKNTEKDLNANKQGRNPEMHPPGKQMNQVDNTKNFAILGGYSLVAIAGLIFIMKFRRKGRRK